MVGLQSRMSPVIVKLKSMIEEGKIGKVLSSSVIAIGGTNDRSNFPAGIKYFTDMNVGGNLVTIFIGHSKSLRNVSSWAAVLFVNSGLVCQDADVSDQ